MGITTFLGQLETFFLNRLDEKEIPQHLDPRDGRAVNEWFREAFAYWLLQNRDDLLGREWVRRGWAEYVLKPSKTAGFEGAYRVKPEAVDKIDAWLADELD